MLDSIYHIALKLHKQCIFCENVEIRPSFTQPYNKKITVFGRYIVG